MTSDASQGVTQRAPGAMAGARVAGLVKLVAALLLLNVSLTFSNIWPTLGVGLNADLSLETAVCVLALLAARRWWSGPSAVGLRWLAGLWLVLVVGRYAEVTVTSLYGRNINLYWDLQHVPSVGAMFAVVADPWLKAGVLVGLVLGLVSLYLGARWSLGVVASAAREPAAQRGLGALAVVVLGLSLAQSLGGRIPGVRVASPVATAYARELGEFAYELSGAGVRDLGPPPVLSSDLSRLGGADVFVIFLESYGAVAWQRPELADPLVPAMARLDADIAETGRFVASALVESTTFGGESWLAHVSLLSGTEIRDPATNVRLMAQERDTMVKLFGRQGYRTVAIMPGMLVAWPEGAFYGFEEIYDHERLGYRGPQFGWWDVNDQYALARVDALEIEPPREQPAFVFFTTISTHAPFVPAPPYQADWARVLTTDPYDAEALDRAWSAWPDWTNLGPSYLEAIEYALSNIGGYLRLRADRDFVMVLVGDHQPPALVSGEGASWDVPVHVIANRPAVLDRLTRHHQFTNTLQPGDQAVARMDTLLPILLDAFGDGGGAVMMMGRRLMTASVVTAAALVGSSTVSAQVSLDVMTFNIRTAAGRDGDNAWPKRQALLVDTIERYAPQVVGMQEALGEQIEYLQQQLPDYRWIGIDRGLNGGVGLSEATPIFYRYAELSPIESGNFWLTDTPDTPPVRRTEGRRRRGGGRIVTWARFYHRDTGRQVYVFNTHFTLRRGQSQLDAADLVAGRVAALPAGAAAIVMGDFNNNAEESDTWRVATARGLRDAWVAADERVGPIATYGGFGPPDEALAERVDWILVGGPIDVERAETVVHNVGGRYPSDHYPVAVRLVIR